MQGVEEYREGGVTERPTLRLLHAFVKISRHLFKQLGFVFLETGRRFVHFRNEFENVVERTLLDRRDWCAFNAFFQKLVILLKPTIFYRTRTTSFIIKVKLSYPDSPISAHHLEKQSKIQLNKSWLNVKKLKSHYYLLI